MPLCVQHVCCGVRGQPRGAAPLRRPPADVVAHNWGLLTGTTSSDPGPASRSASSAVMPSQPETMDSACPDGATSTSSFAPSAAPLFFETSFIMQRIAVRRGRFVQDAEETS